MLPKAASGVIRAACPSDLDALMALWLENTTRAHPFVNADYWQQSVQVVRESYLPRAKTWVYLHNGQIVGFISVLDARFIGALFVEHHFHGKGVGAALMTYVQQHYRWLSLEVYEQNQRACAFYRKHGFHEMQRQLNSETQAYTLIMNWASA
ncbi:putative acetyltransferase [Serratia fonticola]|uniref:Putative acetyltransferase n=1 Tax=Serratia fonticola TaxID=47917 RepID=A0A542CVP0_SERFO|nr:putative acetyltransferase [Serratia fonticola]TQI94911.1 putative acetyltransferase [Serratia fonticola]TVZ69408.1 putative acetyltransferase [Serratia fonticola]